MWTSRRAVSLHVALAVFVPGCVALTWWQVARAVGGNSLSWVYTVEWPIFAAYATYMWWKLVHDEPQQDRPGAAEALGEGAGPLEGASSPARTAAVGAAPAEEEHDDELAAYNRYLADLNASGRQKRW